MGRAPREKSNLLAEKLQQIRKALGLSQDGSINRTSISGSELDKREPSLLILYAYSKVANVFMEVLVDDKIDLPDIIPSEEKSLGKKQRPIN